MIYTNDKYTYQAMGSKEPAAGAKPLKNVRHERFCYAYIAWNRNGTQAYMQVYPNSTYAAAGVSSCQLLENPNIHARISHIEEKAAKKFIRTANQVLAELNNLGFSDPSGVTWQPGEVSADGQQHEPGTLKMLHEMSPDVRRTIRSIEFQTDRWGHSFPVIKLWDKTGKLKELAQHHRLIGSDVTVNVTVGFAERLRAAREKRLGTVK